MPIKVIYIVPPSVHFAGIERVVHDVASGLANQFPDCIDVTVLYCHRYVELGHDLPYKVIWEDAAQLRTFAFRVARWLGGRKYDVVVTAQFEPTVLSWLLHRLTAGKSRFVMHLHGNPKVEERGSLRARFAFAFFDAVAQRMDKVVAASPSLARYVDGRIGRQGLVEYLPNPVRQFTELTREERRDGAVSFVSVGRLAPQKGYDILVAAFAKVIASGLDARLTIVGDGSERDALAVQIEQLGVADRIHLAGRISDPVRELAEADCFVSPSRWEGFGVAIVEAMSAGLYVIATDCEFGPSDLIDCPEKGRIVSTEDVDALASAMADFVRAQRPDGFDQVRRTAAARFSLDHVTAQHAAMLKSVSGRSQCPPAGGKDLATPRSSPG